MVKEHALYDFNSFTCVKASFIIKGTNNLGECSRAFQKNVHSFFFLIDELFHLYQLGQVG